MREIFILVPSLQPAGPVKGAIALANALSAERDVTLVPVKPGPGADARIAADVRLLKLYEAGGWRKGVRRLAAVLRRAGGRGRGAVGAAMISYCLSADATALAARRHARWISSVRGNLPQNYRFDYGPLGPAVAAGHLASLRLADQVVAMTDAMAAQISRYTGRRPVVIGNFVDEAPLAALRQPSDPQAPYTFAFLGSLTRRKQPLALLEAARKLVTDGVELRVEFFGEGPLRDQLATTVRSGGLDGQVTLLGQVAAPYDRLAKADALVLPSLSEGISRAVLEALQLGIPAVLRDVDGNRAVVVQGRNGVLFDCDTELPTAMLTAARLRREQVGCDSLLPPELRQDVCARAFLDLVEAE